MPILDFLFGSPLPTSDERAERIGPTGRHPHLRPGCPQLRGIWPGSGPHPADPPRRGRRRLHPAHQHQHRHPAHHRLSSPTARPSKLIPGGGGSYTVARSNLGVFPGLLAAAALMIDYILVVAVGISAGVGALVSAVPSLQPHTLLMCLGHPRRRHRRQLTWRARNRRGFLNPDLLVCRHSADRDRHRRGQDPGQRRPSHTRRETAARAARPRSRERLVAAEGVRQWMHRDDRCGSGLATA